MVNLIKKLRQTLVIGGPKILALRDISNLLQEFFVDAHRHIIVNNLAEKILLNRHQGCAVGANAYGINFYLVIFGDFGRYHWV